MPTVAGARNALTLTMMLMMIGTLIMAVAPTTSMIGPWAGVVILVSRLIQGFSAGGEFGTATTFLVETAPHKKAFYSSWQVASQGASVFLASLFGYVLNTHLSHEALYSWGWRVPFFFGIIVGPVGLYIRAKLDETDDFKTSVPEKAPLKTTLTRHLGRVLTGAAVVGVATISIYLILYMPTFAVKNLGVSASAGYLGGIVAGLVTLITVPLIGHLADRVGPARVMTWAAVAAIVLAWPLFKLMVDHPSTLTLVLVVSVLGVIMAFALRSLACLDEFAVPGRDPGYRHVIVVQPRSDFARRNRAVGLDLVDQYNRLARRPELLLHDGRSALPRRAVVCQDAFQSEVTAGERGSDHATASPSASATTVSDPCQSGAWVRSRAAGVSDEIRRHSRVKWA